MNGEKEKAPVGREHGSGEATSFEFQKTLYFSKGGQKLTLCARVENYSPEKRKNCRDFFDTMYRDLMDCI